jgi:conjugative relaxase-like TrwC/TraI family protein
MKATWTHLQNPTTGEALGTPLRHYAGAAENLAKAAVSAGMVLSEGLQPEAVRAGKVSFGDVRQALEKVATPEEVAALVAKSRSQQRSAVAFYDVCYNADKSISVFHVAAERAGDEKASKACEQSLLAAADATTAYVAEHLGASRVGYHGKTVAGETSGRWVRTPHLVSAAHLHHVSREGDPQDHVHNLLLNRGLDTEHEWHALDGQMLYKARSVLTVVGSRAQELALAQALGAQFEKNQEGGRRLVGVSQEVCDLFSKRREVIKVLTDQWAKEYLDRYGKEPRRDELVKASQRIARQTRKAKPEQLTERGTAVKGWGSEADERGTSLGSVYKSVAKEIAASRRRHEETVSYDREAVIAAALDDLNARQSQWNRFHLLAAIDAQMPANLEPGTTIDSYMKTLHDFTKVALQREGVVCLRPDQVLDQNVPAELAGDDGFSMFLPRGRETYVAEATVDAEAALLSASLALGAPLVGPEKAAAIAASQGLVEDQAAALVGLLTSGRRLEVLIGPAGTGKTYTLTRLAGAWQQITRTKGNVVALTVSQNAAEVLRNEGFPQAVNLSRWFGIQDRLTAGRPFKGEHAYALKRGQLVVIDEAGMAPTTDIARVRAIVEAQGAKVLLTGDHHQLAAVEQGGALSLLANDRLLREAGAIHELTAVRRFENDWERDASLRLRTGDAAVLETYDDEGRIISASADAVDVEAVNDYLTSHLEGRSTLLIAETAEKATALSMRVRAEIDALGALHGRRVGLHDGSVCSAGDLIQARKNAHDIIDDTGAPLTNRDVLVVGDVRSDDSLLAWRRLDGGTLGASVKVPKAYVAKNVELAYAATVHAAQGRTVDVGLMLVDSERTTVEALYVGATRGRKLNRLYVAHDLDDPDALSPTEALAVVLGRRAATPSAIETQRLEDDASRSLARIGPAWAEVNSRIQQRQFRPFVEEALRGKGVGLKPGAAADDVSPDLLRRIDEDSAAPAFWATVATVHAEGYDVADMLRSTLAGREVHVTADSVAQVLQWRLENRQHMAWEPARRNLTVPRRALAPESASSEEEDVAESSVGSTYLERSPEPELARYSLVRDDLGDYSRQLARAMDNRVTELGRRAAADPPEWAIKHIGEVPENPFDQDEWVAKAGVVLAYREQYVADGAVDLADPIGHAPSRTRTPHRFQDWELANNALGLVRRAGRSVSKMSDLELARQIDRWESAVEVAPRYVKPLLEKAYAEHRKLSASYQRQAAGAPVLGPRMKAMADAVEQAAARIKELQVEHEERRRWYADTEDVRQSAREASAEMSRRHPDREEEVLADVREEMPEREAHRYDRQILQADEAALSQKRGMEIGMKIGHS